MAKDWEFEYAGNLLRVRNSVLRGAKLYVNGDARDHDYTLFATGRLPILSASLSNGEILEIFALSTLLSVEIVAVVRDGERSSIVYESARLPEVPA